MLGVPFREETEELPDGSVGTVIPGVELRLAGVKDGEDGEGEILIKSPHLFSW